MNASLIAWSLAGALIASLYFNFQPRSSAEPELEGCFTSSTTCEIECAELGLTPVQSASLAGSPQSACRRSNELEAQRRERLRDLTRELSAPSVDVARARALAQEIGRLQAQSLDACVDGLLAVREVLTRDQVAQIVSRCCKRD